MPIIVRDVIRDIPKGTSRMLDVPVYTGRSGAKRVALAVESMRRHMTDEGWQIMAGLEHAGYRLYGHGLPHSATNVPDILHLEEPDVVVVQDKREWEGLTADKSRDPAMRFRFVESLQAQPNIFKLTVLKDAHNEQEYHRQSADEIGCHAWIVYYHPKIVAHLAPYVRPEHLIRTYHTIDAQQVPQYDNNGRSGCVISGALSTAYPFRMRLVNDYASIPGCTYLHHPGYHRNGSATPAYLRTLSKFKVAICTASKYGYALRKIIEATACGCIVVTDLPEDDVLPEIDSNLVRVPPSASVSEIAALVRSLYKMYNPTRQAMLATAAKSFYDYRVTGERLADDIETMRSAY